MANRRITYASRKIVTDEGESCSLDYDLLVDELESNDQILENYGISIRFTGVCRKVYREVRGITFRSSEIGRILGLISSGCVFPEELEEVLENILG